MRCRSVLNSHNVNLPQNFEIVPQLISRYTSHTGWLTLLLQTPRFSTIASLTSSHIFSSSIAPARCFWNDEGQTVVEAYWRHFLIGYTQNGHKNFQIIITFCILIKLNKFCCAIFVFLGLPNKSPLDGEHQ